MRRAQSLNPQQLLAESHPRYSIEMRFTALVTFFAYASLAFFQLAWATPVLSTKDMIVKRDNADIFAVLTELKFNLEKPLFGIKGLTASGNVTQDSVEPLLQGVIAHLNTASGQLSKLSPALVRKRQSDDEIANLVAEIITDITNSLDGLLDSAATIPLLGGLLAGVDTSLNQVLLGLSILLAGVLRLVANLLVNVAQLLRNLALGLTLGTLGL